MVKPRVIRLPTGETIEAEIIGKANIGRNSWRPQTLVDKLLNRFTHYELNVHTKDEKGETKIKHDYIPRPWVERGTYS